MRGAGAPGAAKAAPKTNAPAYAKFRGGNFSGFTRGPPTTTYDLTKIAMEQKNLVVVTAATPADARVELNIPGSKLVDFYLKEGYEISTYRSRSRDAAKEEAARLRKQGLDSAYVVLLNGWYGVFQKAKAPKDPSNATEKPKRAAVPVSMKTPLGSFSGNTKEARAFAHLLIEAAKNAEFEADEQAKKDA